MMKNPIKNFEWGSLYVKYDETCKRFDSYSPSLHAIEPKPKNDRELYYALVDKVEDELLSKGFLSLGTYEAILYWKLYSQPAAVKTVCSRIRQDTAVQKSIEKSLMNLDVPNASSLQRDLTLMRRLYKSIGNSCKQMHGISSSTAIPARSTLLHFLYPNVVPIFDKQVLLAVGVTEKNANAKYEFLFDYIPFAWKLASDSTIIPQQGWRETPLRLLDMALWVIRGNTK